MENLCETCSCFDKISCKQTSYPCRNYQHRESGMFIVYLVISLVIALLFVFASCKKDINDPVNFDGYWCGPMKYDYNNIPVFFTICKSIQGDTSKWSDSNIPLVKITYSVDSYSVIYSNVISGNCQGIEWRWEDTWTGTGIIRNDSLFETGTYDMKYYSDDKLIIHTTGNWTAWFARTTTWRPL